MLHRLRLQPCSIATKGYEALLHLVDNTCKDSFDLFYALYRHNENSKKQLDAMATALDEIRAELTADDGSASPRRQNVPKKASLSSPPATKASSSAASSGAGFGISGK